jgi:glycosyltransferase involved in cell wall biosynthesis
MRFSVIIPSCNNGKWIGKTLDSILSQTFKDYEIIVVDDMSTDNSVEVIKSKLRDIDVCVINQSKRLNGGSRNEGIIRARGEYLIFIDSDDWFIDNTVFEDIDKKLNGEDVMFLGYITHQKTSDILVNPIITDLEQSKMSFTCAIWTKVVKNDLMKKVLFPEGTLFEDRIQHYQLLDQVKTFTNLGRAALVWNRENTNCISISKEHIWYTYRFNYCGELYRYIKTLPEGKFKDYVKEELNGYMESINKAVDEL